MNDARVTSPELYKGVLLCKGDKHLVLANQVILIQNLDSVFLTCAGIPRPHYLVEYDILHTDYQHGRSKVYAGHTHGGIRTLAKGLTKHEVLCGQARVCGRVL